MREDGEGKIDPATEKTEHLRLAPKFDFCHCRTILLFLQCAHLELKVHLAEAFVQPLDPNAVPLLEGLFALEVMHPRRLVGPRTEVR